MVFLGIVVGILNFCDLIAISFMLLGDAMTIIISIVLSTIIIASIFEGQVEIESVDFHILIN